MAVKIKEVQRHSLCAKKGVKSGWMLKSINGEKIQDVLDYQFYIKGTVLLLLLETDKGKEKQIKIKKGENDDIGLEFETYLMDKERGCANRCVFCFVDQMPAGMRRTLYFKDDDSRLSFLFGNYITLTNLSGHDIERIIKMRISPVNVSVHTMNPQLRVEMMKNRLAGESLKALKLFADGGIKLNTQLVLCPGINDGKELEFSLKELAALGSSVQSIACVPVGLTKFRKNLPFIAPYDEKSAGEVIDIVEQFAAEQFLQRGSHLAFCSDEFYLLAGRELPGEEYYEDYPQLENGVGLCRSLEEEFILALADLETIETENRVTLATGAAAAPLMRKLLKSAGEKLPKLDSEVFKIKNNFFGESVTVAGLITAKDLIEQLKGKNLGQRLLIPAVMLKQDEEVFLDDITLSELQDVLSVEIVPVANDGAQLLNSLII